jgi:hypothetical protein
MNLQLTYLLTYYYSPIINLVNYHFNSYVQFFIFGWFVHCFQKHGLKGSFTLENAGLKQVHRGSKGSKLFGSWSA